MLIKNIVSAKMIAVLLVVGISLQSIASTAPTPESKPPVIQLTPAEAAALALEDAEESSILTYALVLAVGAAAVITTIALSQGAKTTNRHLGALRLHAEVQQDAIHFLAH